MAAFSPQQLEQLRQVFREELGNAGLRLDEPDLVDKAREDFRFLRKLRTGVDGVAAKIGWLVIAAMVGGLVWVFSLGLNAWRGG